MRTSGTTFTDWEQVEADRRRPLLVDEDFSWSEPPSRRRRPRVPEAKAERHRRRESEPTSGAEQRSETASAYEGESAYGAASVYGVEPIDVEREIDTAWGGRLSASATDTHEVLPASVAGEAALEPPGRRTVVITGRGAERYPTPRRRAEAGLAFHERSGFNPDRVAMWAVLLGIALLLGSIAH
jgi:hypothetical protein